MAEPVLNELIEALRCLPGVGVKSAQRMAFHLLQRDRNGAERLASAVQIAIAQVGHCERCFTLTESLVCSICSDSTRNLRQLCVVETPADQAAMERAGGYQGLYFVLMGHISPLDGIGVEDIGARQLLRRAADGVTHEVIMATNFTAEGEATAYALTEALKLRGLHVTRLARGVPIGSELEHVDLGTIAHAIADRH